MARPRGERPPVEPQEAQDGPNGGGAGTHLLAEEEARERLSAPPGEEPITDSEGQLLLDPSQRHIHQRMTAILAELPAIGKDTRNEQQGFMFRSHDAVLNALNPLFAKHGVYVVPNVLDRVVSERTTSRNSTMYEVNLHVQYRFIAEDGSWIDASAWGEGTDMGDKATNKAMTMAFKNVLAQAFAVSTEDTIDADAGTAEETRSGAATAAAQEPVAPLADRLRARIAEMTVALDVQTQSPPSTWQGLIEDATQRSFDVSFAEAEPPTLEEVGRFVKAQIDSGVSEAPEQLDITVTT